MREDSQSPRPVRDSQSEMSEIVLPNDTNPLGSLLGGRLMHWIDLAGAMAAHRHSRQYAVTVNRVFNTSMEVGVKVFVESYIHDTAEQVGSAYLTFVAVDVAGNKLKVAPVIPETDDQKRRYDDAGRRRESRRAELERKKKH